MIGGQLEAGLAKLDYALEIDPDYAPAYAYRSWFMRAAGDAAAAVRDQRKGVAVDPNSLLNRHGLALTQFHNLEVHEALQTERELAVMYPDDDTCHGYKALFAAYVGERDEALAAAARCKELSADIPIAVSIFAYVEALLGDQAKASKLVQFALDSENPYCPKPLIAPALVVLGRDNEALELIRESKAERCPWFYGIRTDPRLAPLTADCGKSIYT
jgi:tetratricopeptide (TPR) repeat protein